MPDAANGENAPLLAVRDLHAFYGESHVLHGSAFVVPEGEVVTLLGRNGAGKTTTLRAIMGMMPDRRGSIEFRGHELTGLTSNRIARLGIGYCPEERGIFASLDVEENLLLPPQVGEGGMSLDEIYELFPNLKERRRSSGTRLSGGEQQMLAIGRILRTGARLLLLDEPTEGLAPIIVQQIRDVIGKAEGLHDPARRAELPLRFHRGRPPLHHGARPRRGGGAQGRVGTEARDDRNLPGGVEGVPRRGPPQPEGVTR